MLVETGGDDSENANQSQGFFRISWLAGPDIVKVRFDLENSVSNAGDLNNAWWDTTVASMADQFFLGNMNRPGAQGTYRNDSDMLTGLIYDPNVNSNSASNSPIVACRPQDSQTLEFNFTDFGLDGAGNPAAGIETFEFDVDTDGMNGSTGNFFRGMIVEITLSDGTVLTAEMLPDAENPKRSFIGW